jgi:hypothetical protein
MGSVYRGIDFKMGDLSGLVEERYPTTLRSIGRGAAKLALAERAKPLTGEAAIADAVRLYHVHYQIEQEFSEPGRRVTLEELRSSHQEAMAAIGELAPAEQVAAWDEIQDIRDADQITKEV